jgi:hypothetical protein
VGRGDREKRGEAMLHDIGKLKGIDELTAKFKALPNVVDKATASALNKLGTQGVTAAKRGITEVYNIKAADVAKAISRVPAKASYGGRQKRLWTTITAKGGRLGLHKFGGLPGEPPNQKGIMIGRRRGPTVKILRGGSRRPVTPDNFTGHGAFVARMSSGFGGSETNHVGIFVRTNKWLMGNKWRGGSKRHQVIRELKTKGIAESFASHGRDALDNLIETKGQEIMAHELQYQMERAMKKGGA